MYYLKPFLFALIIISLFFSSNYALAFGTTHQVSTQEELNKLLDGDDSNGELGSDGFAGIIEFQKGGDTDYEVSGDQAQRLLDNVRIVRNAEDANARLTLKDTRSDEVSSSIRFLCRVIFNNSQVNFGGSSSSTFKNTTGLGNNSQIKLTGSAEIHLDGNSTFVQSTLDAQDNTKVNVNDKAVFSDNGAGLNLSGNATVTNNGTIQLYGGAINHSGNGGIYNASGNYTTQDVGSGQTASFPFKDANNKSTPFSYKNLNDSKVEVNVKPIPPKKSTNPLDTKFDMNLTKEGGTVLNPQEEAQRMGELLFGPYKESEVQDGDGWFYGGEHQAFVEKDGTPGLNPLETFVYERTIQNAKEIYYMVKNYQGSSTFSIGSGTSTYIGTIPILPTWLMAALIVMVVALSSWFIIRRF